METLPEKKTKFAFGDVVYYDDMTFESLSNDELMMLHTVLHMKYSTKEIDIDKLVGFHTSVVMEMEERGIDHKYVDKLDDSYDYAKNS